MKSVKLAVVIAMALGSVACGNQNIRTESTPAVVADCVFPNTEQAAPGWICDEPQPGLDIQAVGVAEPSKGGMSFTKDMAATDARGRLAEQYKVKVSKMVKKYLGSTGVGDTETVDAAAESAIKSVSSETLVGTRIYKSRTGPNKRLYVLVGLDAAAIEQSTQAAVATSMKNDRATWQKFTAKKSFEEMEAEIAKTQVQ